MNYLEYQKCRFYADEAEHYVDLKKFRARLKVVVLMAQGLIENGKILDEPNEELAQRFRAFEKSRGREI